MSQIETSKLDHFSTANTASPYWLSPSYRHALIVDSSKHLFRAITGIPNWSEARHSLGEGLRLLQDYIQKRMPRIHRGHTVKHQAIWEIFSQRCPQVVVEIGSFDGLDALEFSRMFPSAKVFAFEADPLNYKNVERNVSIRKLITPIPQAAFDFTGRGIFRASGGPGGRDRSRGSGSMLAPTTKFKQAFPDLTFEEEFSVSTTTLFDWSVQNGIDEIDLIWMDAQGAELHILQGMGNLLNGVQAILLEVWTDCYYEGGGSVDSIRDFLRDFGLCEVRSWITGYTGDALFQKTEYRS